MRVMTHATDMGSLHESDPTNGVEDLQLNAHARTPIGALRARLLEETARDVREDGYIKGCPNRRVEAIDWVYADDNTSPFSFLACCESLGIDPDAYREAVLPE